MKEIPNIAALTGFSIINHFVFRALRPEDLVETHTYIFIVVRN